MNQQSVILVSENKDCEKRKEGLNSLVGSLNKDFVQYPMKAESDPITMKEISVKGRGLKREAGQNEKEITELEKTIDLLKNRRKCI